LKRVVDILARHRDTQRLERMEHANGLGVLGENFRQPLVTMRRLIDTAATQLDPGRTHPLVHHFLSHLGLTRPLAGFVPLTLGFHAAHHAAGAMDGRVERQRGLLVLDAFQDDGGFAPWFRPRTPSGRGTPASLPYALPTGRGRDGSLATRSCDDYGPNRAPARPGSSRRD